jgi:hypothetical protein
MEYRSTGVMEYWGVKELAWRRKGVFFFSTTPLLQHSITPMIFGEVFYGIGFPSAGRPH